MEFEGGYCISIFFFLVSWGNDDSRVFVYLCLGCV